MNKKSVFAVNFLFLFFSLMTQADMDLLVFR